MKILFSSWQLPKILLLPLAAIFLACSWQLAAAQSSPSSLPEVRYVDRSKGERNLPVLVSQPTAANFDKDSSRASGPLLWRIEHPDPNSGIRSSYIFGTIHVDDKKVMALPDSVLRRLSAASTLVLELELNEGGSVNVLRKMLFTDGRNLQQVLGEKEYREVSTALTNSGSLLPEDTLSVLKPWAAMLMLIRPENKSGTFLDKKLATIARQAGIKTEGLETIDEQLSVFDDLMMSDQIKLLRSTMSTLAEKEQVYKKMLDAYLSGNLNNLVQVSKDNAPEDKVLANLFNTKLVDERNQKMFERLQSRLSRGNTFIAVGALHLPGELGLLQKLRTQGYRLSRVNY